MNIDEMIERLLDMDIVKNDDSITLSEDAKQLIHKIAEKCNSIPMVQEARKWEGQYGKDSTAAQVYADMINKIVSAPTQIHMRMSARILLPIIDQKIQEEDSAHTGKSIGGGEL